MGCQGGARSYSKDILRHYLWTQWNYPAGALITIAPQRSPVTLRFPSVVPKSVLVTRAGTGLLRAMRFCPTTCARCSKGSVLRAEKSAKSTTSADWSQGFIPMADGITSSDV